MGLTNERWAAARQALGRKQSELSHLLGIARSTLSGYEKDATIPISSIKAIASICGVRESFLLNGDLPILETESTEMSAQAAVEQVVQKYGLPDYCKEAFMMFLQLPKDDQDAVMRICQAFVDSHKNQTSPDEPSK